MNKIKTPIYLDNNATTAVDPRVVEAMLPYFADRFGNSSSKHSFGWMAKSAVDYSRETISRFIGAEPEEIIFTSGATESINLAHFGIAEPYSIKGNHILSTNVEHSAVFDSLNQLGKKGFEVTLIKVNKNGLINPEEIIDNIKPNTILVSVIAANNEIGTLNDIKTIGQACKEKNILFHTDATQAVGKIKFDVNENNVDLVSFTAHKLYGPKGIGALFIRKTNPSMKLIPRNFGGGQEQNLRSGTLNVPGIVGFGKAIEICNEDFEKDSIHYKKLSETFYNTMISQIDGIKLNGSKIARLPNNLNFLVEGVKADELLGNCRDIAFSTASTCSSESGKPSRILRAIGLSDQEAYSSFRVGFGRFNSIEEIEYASSRIIDEITKIRSLKKSFNKVTN